jgi:Tol biopolymer transport system component
MDLDGANDRELPGQTASINLLPTWSPDGKRIAFMTMNEIQGRQHGVGIVNADGTGLAAVNGPTQRTGLASWSPDGKMLAFSSGDEIPHLYVSDPSGVAARRVSAEAAGGVAGFWLPDGKRLIYTRFTPNELKGGLVRVNTDGTGEEALTPGDGLYVAGPNSLSPDGKRMAYLAIDVTARKASLRLMELETKSEVFLNDLEFVLSGYEGFPAPAWFPDGKSLLVAMKTPDGNNLFRISDDGSKKTRLTPAGTDCLAGAVWGSGAK